MHDREEEWIDSLVGHTAEMSFDLVAYAAKEQTMIPAVLTVTMNPAVDVHTGVDQVVPNRKLRCGEPVREPGGGGVNVARALRRLGGDAVAIMPAGGITGTRLNDLLSSEGVTTRIVPISGETPETFTVIENSSDNQFRFVTEGPLLRDEEWTAVLEQVRAFRPVPRFIVASGTLPRGVPEDFFGRLSALAAEAGSNLIVDTSGLPLQHAAGAGTFLIKPNLAEFRGPAGGLAMSDFFLEGAAGALVASGKAKTVVVSMGAGGAVYASERGTRRVMAPTVKVKSRIGAGDSMVAGIVMGLIRDFSFDDAVLYGIAAGSAAVMNPGAELCAMEDVERLYDEMQNRKAA
ncbi:MAG: 1-phosphofructokinase family hexose kinase [Thermoanaerobaculia bacterium]|jgi:6-phosphofructokinase 2